MKTNGWMKYSLGDVAPAVSNDLPAPSAMVWNLSLEDIESTTGRILARSHCKVSELGSSKCSFDSRHVLYSKLRPYLNKVVLPDQPGVGTSELIPLLPDANRLDREYLAYYLRSPEFLDFANTNTRGANLPRIAMSELWKYEISAPALVEEQRAIVCKIKDCLSRVEEIECLRNDALSEAGHLASSLYAALMSEHEWPSKTVGEVVTRSRNGKSIRQDNENATGHVLSLSAVHDVSLDLSAKKPVVLSDAFAEQYRICDGDVFVSRSNTRELVGLSSVAVATPDERLIYPDLLIKLEADVSQVLPRYLAYVLRTRESRRQIKERSVGTSQSMVKISGERLKEVVVPVPPIEVQESLVERFDELHDLTAQLVCEMKDPEYDQLRESVLRKAFAGEL